MSKLIDDIELGEIGLPDIQRPFVWKATKVRDLFDSMYRGYPIGYLLFWENGFQDEHKTIGTDKKQKTPRLLIVDGQQRLTSLYAVIKKKMLMSKDYRSFYIRIAFHPILEKFEVSNPVIEKNPEWIIDISELWQPSINSFQFIHQYMERLCKHRKISELSFAEQKKIADAISQLEKLKDYPLTAMEISSNVDEEQVAEIFVRINSKGTQLNQADFILTIMSVFWDEGRKELEEFCRKAKKPSENNEPSPYNHYFRPNPDQLLRVSVAFGFRRARLEYVYSLLRGKDLETGEFSVEQRDRQFEILQKAQKNVINLSNWHEFFNVLKRAGYPGEHLISSKLNILYTYALWLIGKYDFNVQPMPLREVMARWFFMSALTGRYTGSPESRMEEDLSLLRNIRGPEEFISTLDREIDAVFTEDYWNVTLPHELETASARNPGQFAFYASLCILGARVLYSNMQVKDLLDPTIISKKKALERHHLFPKNFLKKIGIEDRRLINQVANFTLVEWNTNIAIKDQPPSEYAPMMEQQFEPEDLRCMYRWHALPTKWYEMDYLDFLEERRKRMALVVRKAFMQLKNNVRK